MFGIKLDIGKFMGDHYVPQYYLKGFSRNDDGREIWVYDKKKRKKFQTQVKSTANVNGYYSREVEQYLANDIEDPANKVLKKIRQLEQINQSDKEILSKYMAVMMKRVPKGLHRLNEMVPSISEKLSAEYSEELFQIALERPEKKEVAERRKMEIEAILERYSKNPPKEIWLENLPPEKSPLVVDALINMTWLFWVSKPEEEFLTSDNPLFYFESMGIREPKSEVLFPVSKNIALWATWRTQLPEGFKDTTSQIVKEMNRRTASNATRYVFKARDDAWVLRFVLKGNWELHLFQ